MTSAANGPLSTLRDAGALDDFWQRCAAEVERRGGIAGSVRFADGAERRRVGRILGRRLPASVFAVRLADLDAALHASALQTDVLSVLPTLLGRSLRDLPAERRAKREERERLWADAASHRALSSHPALSEWLSALRRTGALQRAAAGQEALRLAQALDVLDVLPLGRGDEELLAELAQRILGDPHALDPGQPVGNMAVRALAHLEGEPTRGAGERRGLWFRYGVVCDQLSSTVLVLNLRAVSPAPLSDLLATCAMHGVPVPLTLQQVHLWCRDAEWAHSGVLVCENPSVMEKIASALGPRAAPLVCVSGQMSIAARLLLRSLVDAGITVAYHGDFDWGGLEIGNQAIRLGAVPWRYSTADYLAAARSGGGGGGGELQGRRVRAAWDPELAVAMEKAGRVVYEEAVLNALCEDARQDMPRSSMHALREADLAE